MALSHIEHEMEGIRDEKQRREDMRMAPAAHTEGTPDSSRH